MPQDTPRIIQLSDGTQVDITGLPLAEAKVKVAAAERAAVQRVQQQEAAHQATATRNAPIDWAVNQGQHLMQLLRPFIGPQSDPGTANFVPDKLGAALKWLIDPANRAAVGGGVGGAVGGILGGPPGAIAGAGLGGAGGSLWGSAGTPANAQQRASDATSAGLEQAAYGLAGEGIGAGMRHMAPPLKSFGLGLMDHAWGPQKAVTSEMSEGYGPEAIRALTTRKINETGITTPIGGAKLPWTMQQEIDKSVTARDAVLRGPEGQVRRPSTSVFSPVTPPARGPAALGAIDPVSDAFDAIRRPGNASGDRIRGTAAASGDVAKATEEIRAYLSHPKVMGYGDAASVRPDFRATHGPRPNPAYEARMKDLMGQAYDDTKMRQIIVDAKTGQTYEQQVAQQIADEGISPYGPTPQVRNQVLSPTAQERQQMVSGYYEKLDKADAWGGDPATAPNVTMAKALARNLKEGYTFDAPSTVPHNARIAELIPVREAAVQAQQRSAQSMPAVRFGEAAAIGLGNPRMAFGSLLNRPVWESIIGQTLATKVAPTLGSAAVRRGVTQAVPNSLRLAATFLGGEQ